MLILDSVTKSFEVVLGGVVATNQCPWVVGWQEHDSENFASIGGGSATGDTASTVAVSVVAAPSLNRIRQIRFFSLRNKDTASVTAVVRLNNNSTLRNYWRGTLEKGDSLLYVDGVGFYVLERAGRIKEGTIVIDLTTDVTGVLPVANGGTGVATLAAHGVLVGNGTSPVTVIAPVASTTKVLTSGGASADPTWTEPAATALVHTNDFRLSLTTALPVTMADVLTAGTLYACLYKGKQIALYDGSSTWNIRSSAEFSLALTLTSGKPYDIFIYDNATVPTLEVLVWTDGTTRATALVLQDGVLVKSGATTRRYVGTLYATAANQTEDSAARRCLWNYYHRQRREFYKTDSTASWTYNVATLRQARAQAANQVDFVIGVAESKVYAQYYCVVAWDQASVAGNTIVTIGLNSTTTRPTNSVGGLPLNGPTANEQNPGLGSAWLSPAVGYSYVAMLESGTNTGANTFYGSGTYAGSAVMTGFIEN